MRNLILTAAVVGALSATATAAEVTITHPKEVASNLGSSRPGAGTYSVASPDHIMYFEYELYDLTNYQVAGVASYVTWDLGYWTAHDMIWNYYPVKCDVAAHVTMHYWLQINGMWYHHAVHYWKELEYIHAK